MDREFSFTVILEPQPEGGYTVLVPALPEVVSEGDTEAEAIANAREAIELVLETYREDGRKVPEDVKTEVRHLTIAA